MGSPAHGAFPAAVGAGLGDALATTSSARAAAFPGPGAAQCGAEPAFPRGSGTVVPTSRPRGQRGARLAPAAKRFQSCEDAMLLHGAGAAQTWLPGDAGGAGGTRPLGAVGWDDGEREQGKDGAGGGLGEAPVPVRCGWQQEECGSVGASRPVPFSIGALIWQGDGSSCRGRLLYLERLWFGIERGADEAARAPELPPSLNVFSLQRVLLSALFSFLISSPAATSGQSCRRKARGFLPAYGTAWHSTAALLPQVPASPREHQATVPRGQAAPGRAGCKAAGLPPGWAMGPGPP